MRITPFQYNNISRAINPKKSSDPVNVKSEPIHTSLANFKMPFYGLLINKIGEGITEETYTTAEKYLESRKRELLEQYKDIFNLKDFDLDKLNGIQKGIEVFKGLTMKEIRFVLDPLYQVPPYRGCSNRCSHCMCNAVPQYFKEDSNMIKSMAWEDFSSLMEGVRELNERVGFNAVKRYLSTFIAPFHDSDCIEIEMKDKNGKIYDFIDMVNLIYDMTKKKVLFDSSGWTPKNRKYQERAERIVEYLSDGNNLNKIYQVNMSINPFHALNERSIKYKKMGDKKAAKKFREFYTDRIANMLLTFTPIIKYDKIDFILTHMSDNEFYDENALRTLIDEILVKLKQMYIKDYHSKRKYIHGTEQIQEFIQIIRNKTKRSSNNIQDLGRAEQLYADANQVADRSELKDYRKSYSESTVLNDKLRTMIDVNGRVYATNVYWTIPTEVQLNFINKDKKTLPPGAILEGAKITREMIENNNFI